MHHGNEVILVTFSAQLIVSGVLHTILVSVFLSALFRSQHFGAATINCWILAALLIHLLLLLVASYSYSIYLWMKIFSFQEQLSFIENGSLSVLTFLDFLADVWSWLVLISCSERLQSLIVLWVQESALSLGLDFIEIHWPLLLLLLLPTL